MFAAGMHSCVIAVHFCPHAFALPWLVALPFGLPHPPTSWFMVGLRRSGKYTYSPLRISVWQVPGGRWPVGGCHGYPLCLHFAHICSLPALLSIGTYPPFLIIAYRQVKDHQNVQKMHHWQKAPGVNGLSKNVLVCSLGKCWYVPWQWHIHQLRVNYQETEVCVSSLATPTCLLAILTSSFSFSFIFAVSTSFG